MRYALYHALVLAASGALAAPTSRSKRDVTALSSDQLAAFAPFTEFARAAYCPSDKIVGWQCGREYR